MRRRQLIICSGGLTTVSSLSLGTGLVSGDTESSGSILFDDQTSDGSSIVVSELTTEIDARFAVRNLDADTTIVPPTEIEAGSYESYSIGLTEFLSETAEVAVSLIDSDGQGFARDTALVQVDEDVEFVEGIEPTLIEADSDAGFNYPYYLYAPTTHADQEPRPLVVEPNNSGQPSDDFDDHIESAEMALEHGEGRFIADTLNAPYLVPVLPRPMEGDEPNAQNLYRRYLQAEDSPSARPDLQVIAMAEDARERIEDANYPLDEDGLLLNGFSQSGDWVSFFTALHPEKVRSVTAGGVNGMPILPITEANGYTLEYHVGVDNVEELVGRPIDVNEFSTVDQFYYMGEFDGSDTLPFFQDRSLAEKVRNVLGRHMILDRFPYSQLVYQEADFNSIFRVYEDAHHTPRPASNDLVEFHRRSLDDEDIDGMRDDLGGNVPDLGLQIEFVPNHPEVGDEITFNAHRSDISDGNLGSFEWEIANETQSGSTITHTFSEAGGHNVELRATDAAENSYRTVEQIVVREDGEKSDEDTPDEPEGAVTFNDQSTDGTSIAVSEISVNVDATLAVRHDDTGIIYEDDGFEAGDYEDYRIELTTIITDSTKLSVRLTPRGGGERFAHDDAFLTIEKPPEIAAGIDPTMIEADPDAGFEYPYFLFAPTIVDDGEPNPLLVHPNNTGQATDDLDVHLDSAQHDINGWARDLGTELDAPAIVPAFPRPLEDPVDGNHYIHALDRETLQIESGPLERVDRQLLNMVAHAREYLDANEYPVADDGIMLNGFSASGNFVERFVALHPDEVVSVTAGGLNGMVTLPIEEANGHTLEYHVGVANVDDITGDPFDVDAFRDVPQYLYLGDIDHNDTIPFSDAWTGDFDQIALDVYGQDMQGERFPFCKAIHDAVDTNAIFRYYEGIGHTPRPAMDDVAEFHERVLAGDDVESIRRDLGGNVPNLHAYVEYAPGEPEVGEQVAFDATETDLPSADPSSFEWDFGTWRTAAGDTVTHRFTTPGQHEITLTVTDESGDTHEATQYVTVTDESLEEPSDSETFEVDSVKTVDTVESGEEFALSANIINEGDAIGEQTIELRDVSNGEILQTQNLELASGENITVSFENLSITTVGECELEVATIDDSLTQNITVVDPDPLAEYASDDGTIEVDGMLDAIADYREGGLGIGDLLGVIDAYRTGDPVI